MSDIKYNTGLTHDEILRYSRNLLIPGIGIDGQQRLKNSSVLIIGAGGLGSPAAVYLAAAGVGRIGLVDHDSVALSNLQRQILHGTDNIGQKKVESGRQRLHDLNPGVHVDVFDEPFSTGNALRLIDNYDLIIDASDNLPTRYLSNDVCVKTGKPNVYGAVYQFEGQVSVFWADHGPCYRCLFPSPPPPGTVPTCDEGGILGVVPGTIGTLQASEALKIILGIGNPLTERLLLYDARSLTFNIVSTSRNTSCPVCSVPREEVKLVDYDAFCGAHTLHQKPCEQEHAIGTRQLAAVLAENDGVQLIDVREPHELQISTFPGAVNIPYGSLESRLAELDPDRAAVLICRNGARAARAVEILLGAGFVQVQYLAGGINEWAREISPDLPVY